MTGGGTVLLVRHGRTAWNDTGRIQGWLDVELSARGKRESTRLAAEIERSHDVTAVVSSPLERARQTANRIADRVGCPGPEPNTRWRERRFGHFAGAESDAVFAAVPSIHPRSADFDAAARPPGGESVAAVQARVADAWTAVADRARDGDTVVVVTHTTPLRLALGIVRSSGLEASLRVEAHPPGSLVRTSVAPTGSPAVVESE